MSDVNINPESDDNEGDEEVSAEEIAAAETVNLFTMGIEPMTTPISDLISRYNAEHSVVEKYRKVLKGQKADPSDPVVIVKKSLADAKESAEMADVVKGIREGMASVANHAFGKPHTLLTASVLLEEAKALVSLLETEARYHFDNSVQEIKTETGVLSTPAETALHAKLVCVKLGLLIENRVKQAELVSGMFPADQEIPPQYVIPAGLIKTPEPGKRGGFNREMLPKLPRPLPGVETSAVSRVSTAHLAFRFVKSDGTEVDCTGHTLRSVMHDVVSSGAYRVDDALAFEMLKKKGHGIGATDTEWSLEFETGTLYGKKVAG